MMLAAVSGEKREVSMSRHPWHRLLEGAKRNDMRAVGAALMRTMGATDEQVAELFGVTARMVRYDTARMTPVLKQIWAGQSVYLDGDEDEDDDHSNCDDGLDEDFDG